MLQQNSPHVEQACTSGLHGLGQANLNATILMPIAHAISKFRKRKRVGSCKHVTQLYYNITRNMYL